jgi:serine-type D-Ala-D-Ala carboxypeptidase
MAATDTPNFFRERPHLNDSASIVASTENQEQVFSRAFAILRQGIAERAFPTASVAITQRGRLIARKAFGRLTYDPDAPAVSEDTLFDLASLTKVVATTTMAAILYQRGLLELDAPVAGVVPEFAGKTGDDPRRRGVTFHMLLGHSSGLPAHEKFFLKVRTREELLQAAYAVPLTADPGTRAEYSDIGFIVLGAALERIAGEALDAFCKREIFAPLGMRHTGFNPPAELRGQIPPTADMRIGFGGRVVEGNVQGEVQDDNAFVMGGVAPHAGLFAPAGDLALFAHAMLQGGSPILLPGTVEHFTRRELNPAGTSRALGWDTPSGASLSGKYFGPRTFGHLGYTGTSLWMDPDRELSVTLLTNRTFPESRMDFVNRAIRQVSPKVHDAVIEALEA